MSYPYFVTLIWFTAIIVGSLGVVIHLGSRKISSRIFALNTFVVCLWMIAVSLIPLSTNVDHENYILRTTFLLGIIIASAFYVFCQTFPFESKLKKLQIWILLSTNLTLAYLLLSTNLIIGKSFQIDALWRWGQYYGKAWFIFDVLFVGLWVGSVIQLIRKYREAKDGLPKKHLLFMIYGLIIGFVPPNVFSIILPRLGVFELNWIGPVSGGIFWVCVISYSILRYRQLNVRAVFTEVLAIAMAAIFFVNIFIETQLGVYGKIAAFVVFLILAYYLIRGTLKEAEQREMLNDLNHNLEARVAAQTLEIRKAYEAEKHARQELEKLNDAKDQFIMITQHHLRTPVVSMNWTLESILSGAYGKIESGLRTVLDDALASGKRLMRIVDDFLNITAVKIGTNILDIRSVSLKAAIRDILAELRDPIQKMRLDVSYPTDDASWPLMSIDESKIRESLFIVFENAVRYNAPDGKISVTTAVKNNAFQLTVDNTGIGISQDEAQKIGTALFYRGEFARKAYPIGMGVGLSVVKSMVHAHKGKFNIESKGPGTGAKVTIVLPIKAG